MHSLHGGYTVALTIRPGHYSILKRLLVGWNKNQANSLMDFEKAGTTLFATAFVLPAQNYDGETLPETFVFTTCYCGPFVNHLNELIATAKPGICEAFSHCYDFPENGLVSEANLKKFFIKNRYKNSFNSRYNCITKQAVQDEKALRNEIENYVDIAQSAGTFTGLSALQIKGSIKNHIIGLGTAYGWALTPYKKSLLELFVTNRESVVLTALYVLGVLYYWNFPVSFIHWFIIGVKVLIVFLLLLIVAVWYIERGSNLTAPRPADSHTREVAATQTFPVINQMVASGPLKKGKLRRYFYDFALRAAALGNHIFMDVPTVTSIRWLVINNRKRLLFLSNYANATDFYVRDFLNGSTPKGINFMFAHGAGFPDARWLIFKGIKSDPEGYMNVIHYNQHVTQFWYAHERNMTVDVIKKNRLIRNGFSAFMVESQAKKWLNLL